MISDIVDEIRPGLESKGTKVYYGRDAFERTVPSENTIQVLDPDTGDDFEDALTIQGPGQVFFLEWQGVRVRFFALATVQGATELDQKRLAKSYVRAFLVELAKSASSRAIKIRNVTGGFMPLDDDATQELGARYELFLQLGSGVTGDEQIYAPAGQKAVNAVKVSDGDQLEQAAP